MPTAIITGGSRGIGFGVAEGLLQDGFAVALCALHQKGVSEAAQKLRARYPQSTILECSCDVSDYASVHSLFSEVTTKLHTIDLVFNNAGVYAPGSTEISSEEFSRVISINLEGAFNVAKEAVSHFQTQKSGYLINISSVCGVHGFAGVGAYTASKFGLLGLNESLFRELAPQGIKVTAICPSWVHTDMSKHSPLKSTEMIRPHDLYLTVRYLLSLSPAACPREIVVECMSDTL